MDFQLIEDRQTILRAVAEPSARFDATGRALQVHGDPGYAEGHQVARRLREACLPKHESFSHERVLTYVGPHVPGLPRSY